MICLLGGVSYFRPGLAAGELMDGRLPPESPERRWRAYTSASAQRL